MRPLLQDLSLSRQEERVLLHSVAGMSDKEIASEMGLALNTIRTYWQRIREKVGGETRAEIVARLIREGAVREFEAKATENEELLAEIARRRAVEEQLHQANIVLAEAEELLRGAAEASFDAFMIFRPAPLTHDRELDFTFEFLNSRAERYFGLSRQELIGRRGSEVIPGYNTALLFQHFRNVLQTGQGIELDIVSVASPMRGRFVHVQAVKAGECIALTARDVTDQRRKQEELREACKRFKAALEALNDGVLTIGLELSDEDHWAA